MTPVAVALIAFTLMLIGILLGSFAQRVLPDSHLGPDAKDVVKLSMGVIGTLAALVLGLLVASAQASYASREGEIKQITGYVILLDHLLAQYGDEAWPARASLRQGIPPLVERIWGEATTPQSEPFRATAEAEAFHQQIQELEQKNEIQRGLQKRIIQLTTDLAQARLRLFSQIGSSIPIPFLVVLMFWLTILFAGFCLVAPANPTAIAVLLLCALSVSGAIFLILQLDQPFSGIMAIPSEPLRNALIPLS